MGGCECGRKVQEGPGSNESPDMRSRAEREPKGSNNYCKSHLFFRMKEQHGLLSPLRGVCTVGEGHYFLGVLQGGEVK